jgi:hypothetical protein
MGVVYFGRAVSLLLIKGGRLMDPLLMALTLDLQEKARKMTQTDNLPMQSAALDMLDYLGRKIHEDLAHKEAN